MGSLCSASADDSLFLKSLLLGSSSKGVIYPAFNASWIYPAAGEKPDFIGLCNVRAPSKNLISSSYTGGNILTTYGPQNVDGMKVTKNNGFVFLSGAAVYSGSGCDMLLQGDPTMPIAKVPVGFRPKTLQTVKCYMCGGAGCAGNPNDEAAVVQVALLYSNGGSNPFTTCFILPTGEILSYATNWNVLQTGQFGAAYVSGTYSLL